MSEDPGPVPVLSVRTRRLDTSSPTMSSRVLDRLAEVLPGPGGHAWLRRGQGFVGWGEALRIRTTGPGRFTDAEARWRRVVDAAHVDDDVRARGSGPIALGSFAFADDSPAGGCLIVPEVLVATSGGRAWLTTAFLMDPATHDSRRVEDAAHDAAQAAALDLLLSEAAPPGGDWGDWGDVVFAEGALGASAWQDTVAATVARIEDGEVDKVVLARDLVARTARPVDDRVLLARLAEAYPATWTFAVDGLVGASPELLARTEGGLVASRVLAGTIRRSGDDSADLALAARLARSGKDLAEHQYAVSSVVDALAPHCSAVNVPDAPSVLHLANVMHLATDVTGVLAEDASSLTIAAALHPSAAVCGTPTKVAEGIIAEVEGMDRDRYAGPVGWLDARGDGEWAIALRCGRISHDRRSVRLFAGCGIVAGSDPAAELAESAAKFVPMQDALTG